MPLSKRYNPQTSEPQLAAWWREMGVYEFEPSDYRPVYAIDTPPPTVSGQLHLGHMYSYSHTDFIARFWRMQGYNVFYPMGYDDNGLPTERLVERWHGVKASEVGREAFIALCLSLSESVEKEYASVWRRLGLSIDWRYTYRTIDENARRISQRSFIELYRKGLAYRQRAPAIWCPECQTAIAQAELSDLERPSHFYTLRFLLANGDALPIATTRPELLPACVAVFAHPNDVRYTHLFGQNVTVPLFNQRVPFLADAGADPQKGTGAVMCCTFGDAADVGWWYAHNLPLVEAIGRDGRMTEVAPSLAGQTVEEARASVIDELGQQGALLATETILQSVRVHERCDTPAETILSSQWFVRILDQRDELLALGERLRWLPDHMGARYRQWVENLAWDWCISRQRYFGVTFPVWYCDACGEVMLAGEEALPVDPTTTQPSGACPCGSTQFTAEEDVMDTWATSSLTPQIVGGWLSDPALFGRVFPMSLRPQAHDIIRTWAFYTIVKSHYHLDALPWKAVAISGWGLAPEGEAKISKSRGGGPVSPTEMMERYSADAVRYWAAGTGFGKDAVISEEKMQAGARLVTKLWNVARFSQRFISGLGSEDGVVILDIPEDLFTPADRWILARLHQVIQQSTRWFHDFDYAAARSEVELFFWNDLADNYVEMAKKRLYDGLSGSGSETASKAVHVTLYHAILSTVKLFAPFLPYVTEQIYQGLFAQPGGSIHTSHWPLANPAWADEDAIGHGNLLVAIATTVRRFKSENAMSLGSELERLLLACADARQTLVLMRSRLDLASVTRANKIEVLASLPDSALPLATLDGIVVAL